MPLAGKPGPEVFSDVRDHLSVARMREAMTTKASHGRRYAAIRLAERSLEATPTFDRGSCEGFGRRPLEWDGHGDSLRRRFDRERPRRMEQVRDHGRIADIPRDRML
jgi:hypothetical protein